MNDCNLSYLCRQVKINIENVSIEDLKRAFNFLYVNQNGNICKMCKRLTKCFNKDNTSEFICYYCIKYFNHLKCGKCQRVFFTINYKNPKIFQYNDTYTCAICTSYTCYPVMISDYTTEKPDFDPLNTNTRKIQVKNLDWAKKYINFDKKSGTIIDCINIFNLHNKFDLFLMELCTFAKPENFCHYCVYNGKSIVYKCERHEIFCCDDIDKNIFLYFLIILKKNRVPKCLQKYMFTFIKPYELNKK